MRQRRLLSHASVEVMQLQSPVTLNSLCILQLPTLGWIWQVLCKVKVQAAFQQLHLVSTLWHSVDPGMDHQTRETCTAADSDSTSSSAVATRWLRVWDSQTGRSLVWLPSHDQRLEKLDPFGLDSHMFGSFKEQRRSHLDGHLHSLWDSQKKKKQTKEVKDGF